MSRPNVRPIMEGRRLEHYERDEPGSCSCGRSVVRVVGSDFTANTDRTRYAYPESIEEGWCIFRCEDCREVIADTWRREP